MIKRVAVSAPGKVLWVGNYTVVNGGISHVLAINRRVYCSVEESDKYLFRTSYGEFDYPGNELTKSVLEACNIKAEKKFEITLQNDNDFQVNGKKTGLGSSSAATVALAAALLYMTGGTWDLNAIHECAQKANALRQRGTGSGFDIAAATYGSLIYRRFSEGKYYIEPLKIGNDYDMFLSFTGNSADTKSLVDEFFTKLRTLKLTYLLQEVNDENEMAVTLLKRGMLENAVLHVRRAKLRLRRIFQKVGLFDPFSLEDQLEEYYSKFTKLLLVELPGAGGGDSIFFLIERGTTDIEELRKNVNNVIKVIEDNGVRVENEID
ncbi:GHMP kinase [Sulfolobales archaeon HS-7]|nr:GHMP kinase [Sulfolobales archaeon HS-7]